MFMSSKIMNKPVNAALKQDIFPISIPTDVRQRGTSTIPVASSAHMGSDDARVPHTFSTDLEAETQPRYSFQYRLIAFWSGLTLCYIPAMTVPYIPAVIPCILFPFTYILVTAVQRYCYRSTNDENNNSPFGATILGLGKELRTCTQNIHLPRFIPHVILFGSLLLSIMTLWGYLRLLNVDYLSCGGFEYQRDSRCNFTAAGLLVPPNINTTLVTYHGPAFLFNHIAYEQEAIGLVFHTQFFFHMGALFLISVVLFWDRTDATRKQKQRDARRLVAYYGVQAVQVLARCEQVAQKLMQHKAGVKTFTDSNNNNNNNDVLGDMMENLKRSSILSDTEKECHHDPRVPRSLFRHVSIDDVLDEVMITSQRIPKRNEPNVSHTTHTNTKLSMYFNKWNVHSGLVSSCVGIWLFVYVSCYYHNIMHWSDWFYLFLGSLHTSIICFCLAAALQIPYMCYYHNYVLMKVLLHLDMEIVSATTLGLWCGLRDFYLVHVLSINNGRAQWSLVATLSCGLGTVAVFVARFFTEDGMVGVKFFGQQVVIVVAITSVTLAYSMITTAVKVWYTQRDHIKMLKRAQFIVKYRALAVEAKQTQSQIATTGTTSSFDSIIPPSIWSSDKIPSLSTIDSTCLCNLIEDRIAYIDEHDEAPEAFGVQMRPTLLNALNGYLVTAATAIFTKYLVDTKTS